MINETNVTVAGNTPIIGPNPNRHTLIVSNPSTVDIWISTKGAASARGICVPSKGAVSFNRFEEHELTEAAWYAFYASSVVITVLEEVCEY